LFLYLLMPNQKISTKKLKAIVFADLVNFTSISEKDEQKALDLIETQVKISKPIVLKHNGEWLKELGDGFLFCFDSSLEAVRCSIEIQEAIKSIEGLTIRIGIHQGDIIMKDGDIFGSDVNIASRVQGFSPEGGISLSDKVYKDILSVKDIKTKFIGHRKLKGVEQETKIRCITSHNLPAHKTNFLPKVVSYFSFFFGFLFLILFILSLIALSLDDSIFRAEFLARAKMEITVTDVMMELFIETMMMFLLGYSCLSFYRGISLKSQKGILLFTYFFVTYNIFEAVYGFYTGELNANPNYNAKQTMIYNILLFLMLFVFPLFLMGIFKIFFKKIKSNK